MKYVCVAVLAAGLALVTGCTDRVAEQVGAMNKSNIQRVANLYSAYQNIVSGAGPADEKAFKEFVSQYAKDKLKMMGIDPNNTESIFISERDGQPFKIRYKVAGSRGAVAPVAFEQTGKDGKKQVAFTGGSESKVEDCDDAKYNDLWAGKYTSAPAAAPTGPGGGARPVGGSPGGRPAGAPTGPPGGKGPGG